MLKNIVLGLLFSAFQLSFVFSTADVVVPPTTEYNIFVLLRNVLLCHVVPYWTYALTFVISSPDDYGILPALRHFVLVYLRDAVIMELLNTFARRLLLERFLFENKAFLMADTRFLLDFQVIFYSIPAVPAAGAKPLPAWKNFYGLTLRLIVRAMQNFGLALYIIMIEAVCCLYFLASTILYLLTKEFTLVPFVFYLLIVVSLRCKAHVKQMFGRPSIFDPYYASYAELMCLPPKDRLETLENMRVALLGPEAQKQLQLERAEKLVRVERFRECRKAARKVHRDALKEIAQKKEESEKKAKEEKAGEKTKEEAEKKAKEEKAGEKAKKEKVGEKKYDETEKQEA